MKFATKTNGHYPPHLRHIAAIPWENVSADIQHIWNKMQTNCI